MLHLFLTPFHWPPFTQTQSAFGKMGCNFIRGGGILLSCTCTAPATAGCWHRAPVVPHDAKRSPRQVCVKTQPTTSLTRPSQLAQGFVHDHRAWTLPIMLCRGGDPPFHGGRLSAEGRWGSERKAPPGDAPRPGWAPLKGHGPSAAGLAGGGGRDQHFAARGKALLKAAGRGGLTGGRSFAPPERAGTGAGAGCRGSPPAPAPRRRKRGPAGRPRLGTPRYAAAALRPPPPRSATTVPPEKTRDGGTNSGAAGSEGPLRSARRVMRERSRPRGRREAGGGGGGRSAGGAASPRRERRGAPAAGGGRRPAMEEGAADLRQRKKQNCTESDKMASEERNKENAKLGRSPKYMLIQRFAKLFFGCLAAVTSGMMYAVYLSTYHERKFWFSSRQELEREITFQGDSAIYYSFYKELLKAPSFERGVYELTHNNKTVSLKTINAVQQMTLYPELIASVLYQASGSEEVIEPVYFYIGIVFGLQGIYVTALFVTSWVMSGTWLAGMLTVAWFIINRTDTTRIDYSIPSRENWALPYFACQVAALTGYLKKTLNCSAEKFCYLLVSASTYTFMMMWEYSHYLLFVQAVSLFLLDSFALAQTEKVHEVYKIYLFSLFLGYLLQFENSALLVSPLLSLVAALMLSKCLQMNMKKGTFMSRLLKIMYIYLVLTITVTLNFLLKMFVPHKENEHLLKFIEVKLGLNTTKMKYLWTPYVCMLAAFGVCSPELWMTLFKWLRLKAVHPILLALILSMAVPTIIGFSLWKEFFPRIMTELSELQEFYDPDTVELMTWIKRQAPVAAVFAGSPQLMGVIKLCTGWMVSSLPLYNDDDLLKRNENIYQIYSKRSAEDIYKILTSYKANFLVIEDSICNEVGPVRGCRVKDLLDIANGHVVCEEGDSYAYSKYGRFCHEIKMNYSPYVNYFTRVYWNRSYFVYRINTVISFQS
ncbi:probable C-mannosyltransferase DPY19L4 isoform X3 [Aquila chrysaetos chrysaetos]|uniref:probable C-mannosyltransferase DPY19L4 isoform X3 n=1 Tax=Aquila chrysaetos chrysaetos TaxID=223781 RepID=UPI001B7D3472|nr:probable C-mannosyltransferase DPY19L4 isoform X3 [Aquila chrysaetos chrysaetos]